MIGSLGVDGRSFWRGGTLLAAASLLMFACSAPEPEPERGRRIASLQGISSRSRGPTHSDRRNLGCAGPGADAQREGDHVSPLRAESGERRRARAGDPSNQSEHRVFRRHQRRRLAIRQCARPDADLDAADGYAAVTEHRRAGARSRQSKRDHRGHREMELVFSGRRTERVASDLAERWRLLDRLTNPLFTDRQISGVVIRGATVLVANRNPGRAGAQHQRRRDLDRISGDAGSGLPDGGLYDLVEDRQNANRLYVTMVAEGNFVNSGVFRSDNLGLTWVNVSQNDPGAGGAPPRLCAPAARS